MSEYTERIAKALAAAKWETSRDLAPLVEAAIEAAIGAMAGSEPVAWAAALSVLEGKEKQ